jgi:hypothetical protein
MICWELVGGEDPAVCKPRSPSEQGVIVPRYSAPHLLFAWHSTMSSHIAGSSRESPLMGAYLFKRRQILFQKKALILLHSCL